MLTDITHTSQFLNRMFTSKFNYLFVDFSSGSVFHFLLFAYWTFPPIVSYFLLHLKLSLKDADLKTADDG